MNCPNCKSLMKCVSEIHKVPNQLNKERMDLHCSANCNTICHMGVITEDPKEWICHEYTFPMSYKNNLYVLFGYNKLVDPIHQFRDSQYQKTGLYKTVYKTMFELELLMDLYPSSIKYKIEIDFHPLSTGDDMHLKAWDLFHRLRKLVVFS